MKTTSPCRCPVCRCVDCAAIEILMHIKIKINSVFFTKVGNLLNFVKIFFVIFRQNCCDSLFHFINIFITKDKKAAEEAAAEENTEA